jgi:protein-S-isoprenylcysteine O-methyltransferase Ste14
MLCSLRLRPVPCALFFESRPMNISTLWQFLYWTWIVSEVGILVITRTRRGGGKIRDRGSLLILWPTIVLSITAAFWIGETHAHTIFPGARWVAMASLVFLLAGLLVRWIAILTLGRSFSANVAIHATQTVHKTGLFRFVRHPSYSGMLLIFVAIGLATRNWLGFAVVMILPTAALLYRIHVEEAALGEAFGGEYAEYSRHTKRLIPGLY